MSRENVELAYQATEAFNRRDLDAFLDLMDDDVEIASRIVVIEGDLLGHDGIRRWWENWLDTWPDYKIEVVEVRDFGDRTVAALRAVGHGAGSETPLDETVWQVARWRRGKCVFFRIFNNRAEALEAVGLPEQ